MKREIYYLFLYYSWSRNILMFIDLFLGGNIVVCVDRRFVCPVVCTLSFVFVVSLWHFFFKRNVGSSSLP